MKAVCHVCERVFELAKVTIENDSGIEGSGGFLLLPRHPPLPGKKKTNIVSAQTGEIIGEMCDGSLRPPKIKLQ